MHGGHAVFGQVEEVVGEVLVPGRGILPRKAAEAHGQKVHVQESDLGPGVEGRGHAKACGVRESRAISWISGRRIESGEHLMDMK